MRTGQQLEAFSTTFGFVASLVFHASLFAWIASATAHFDFDFELTLPDEVEFGLTEAMISPVAPTSPPAPKPEAVGLSGKGGDDKRGDESIADAGVPDASTDAHADAGTVPDAGADAGTVPDSDAVPDSPLPVSAPTLEGPSRIPAGAQLALRIDMKRIRESPLGPDVTRFLDGIPDWQLILDGSGIDPVDDLDRLMVASPNLERSKLVLAGRHRRDESFARDSVKRMARARGKSARWKLRYGIQTAPWHNRDRTQRTIALLGTRHFSITRRQDLRRVLALAKARELRDAQKEHLVVARGPDALLSMGPEEALSLEIEGVHQFVIGSVKHIPIRLRAAVRETGPNEATVSTLATYVSDEQAREAAAYWKRVATFYSEQLVMTLAGFGKTLRRIEFEPDEERIEVSFKLSADQIRFILSYLEGRLHRVGSTSRPVRAPRAPAEPTSAAKPAPTKKGP